MPGCCEAKNQSFDFPYIVANINACPFPALNLKLTLCPGRITGSLTSLLPTPLNVPLSTNIFGITMFSTIRVRILPEGAFVSSSLLQEVNENALANTTADNAALNRFFFINFELFFKIYIIITYLVGRLSLRIILSVCPSHPSYRAASIQIQGTQGLLE